LRFLDDVNNGFMRLHVGAVPESEGFVPDESWKPLREPGPVLMQCFALPLGIAASAVLVLLWIHWTPVTKTPVVFPILLAAVMLATFPIHEIIHAAAYPGAGKSPKTILGVWPSRMLFYAHYDGELSRNRFIAVLGMPLLVMSIVPLLVSALVGHASVTIAFASAFNALAAGGDILGICLLLFQVPRTATIHNHGWKTFWKRNQ
jgi:hypothetical protein